jgi:hypothetical protein
MQYSILSGSVLLKSIFVIGILLLLILSLLVGIITYLLRLVRDLRLDNNKLTQEVNTHQVHASRLEGKLEGTSLVHESILETIKEDGDE